LRRLKLSNIIYLYYETVNICWKLKSYMKNNF